MEGCDACAAVEPINAHFEAIFDFLDERGLDYGELPLERIRIHSELKHRHA